MLQSSDSDALVVPNPRIDTVVYTGRNLSVKKKWTMGKNYVVNETAVASVARGAVAPDDSARNWWWSRRKIRAYGSATLRRKYV